MKRRRSVAADADGRDGDGDGGGGGDAHGFDLRAGWQELLLRAAKARAIQRLRNEVAGRVCDIKVTLAGALLETAEAAADAAARPLSG